MLQNVYKEILYLAQSTQVKRYKCLVKRKVKVKFANKQGRQPKKRITGNSRVYPKIYPILLFHDLSRALCLWFAFILTTCFDGLFSEFRIKVTGNSLFFSFAFLLISSFVAHFKYRLFCLELWLANFLGKERQI